MKGKKKSTVSVPLLSSFFLTKRRLSREHRLTLRGFNTRLPPVITEINNLSANIERASFIVVSLHLALLHLLRFVFMLGSCSQRDCAGASPE